MIANWVKQNVTTVGTGKLLLGNTIDSFVSVGSAFQDGTQLFYSVIEGNNREDGIGIYTSGSNDVTRDLVLRTIVEGTYTENGSPISLTGNATISVSASTEALTTHEDVWRAYEAGIGTNGLVNLPTYTSFLGSGIKLPAFASGTMNELGFKWHIGSDIHVGKPMYPSIRWSPSTADTGEVRWGIEYTMASRGTEFGTVTLDYVNHAAAGTSILMLAPFAETILAPEPDSIITGRVFRDATHPSDTFTGNAILHSCTLHYQSNMKGTPNKDPNFYWI